MLREGIKLVRMLGQTPPLNNSFGPEISPGPAVTTDDQIQSWLINGASTQYHPIGTCAMLPKSQSGVVNAQLQVYGTSTSNFLAHLLAIPARLIFLATLQPTSALLIPQYSHSSSVAMYVIIMLEAPIYVLTFPGRLEDLHTDLRNKRLISLYVQMQRLP
jgi:hypothetical protein